jgi:ADP-L-glycero-D-manno-heptose 6-epimerase
MDKREFRARLDAGTFDLRTEAILHNGACSDTMETDGRYMLENNFGDSKAILSHALTHRIPFVYASSAATYGASPDFSVEPRNERPLNVYGWSKLLFDQHVRPLLPHVESTVVGLRYFNVYGPHEQHKGRMASVMWHFWNQYRADGRVRLFEGADGIANGEQRRDFVSVDDVVRVNLDFLDHPERSGIFNVGSGRAATFNDVAMATVNACRAADGEGARTLAELVSDGVIRYIPMPPALVGKYQSYTEADLSRLRAAGYAAPMQTIEEGVPRYNERLISGTRSSA